MHDEEVIREFLIESNENLTKLDRELVELEKNPQDNDALGSVFRTIHTIKGTCGFFGYGKLGAVAHVGENLLSLLRDRKLILTPEIATALLKMVDAIRQILNQIETTGEEGERDDSALIATLTRLQQQPDGPPLPRERSSEGPVSPATIGDILMQRAGVTPTEVQEAAKQQEEGDPRHLGEILVEKGAVRPSDVVDALRLQQASHPAHAAVADSTIRVDVGLLDKLMNLVGELVLARNQILQVSATKDSSLGTTSQRLNLITSELQEGVMKTRMQPIGVVWGKLPRVVRDLAASCGKKIRLEMEGSETELDKTIIEAIKDPLTHIVRNSCDHGIEMPDARIRAGKNPEGTLRLRAYHEGGHVIIEISDDGAGIDPEKIKNKALQKGFIRADQVSRMSEREIVNLVFVPGLSTAEKVTSISGRGVGTDVVKTNIEKIGGVVDLFSKTGEGTVLRVKIPLTLAIIPGLVVTLLNSNANKCVPGEERFVIPQASLLELVCLEGDAGRKQIESIHGTPVYRRRGKLLPLVYLNRVLNTVKVSERSEVTNIVILQAEDRSFGLVVDGISDTQEIVVKPLGKQLKGLGCYAGATIMGDGKVALILDVMGLAQLAGIISESRESARVEAGAVDHSHGDRQTLLCFRTGRFERLAVPLSLVDRLEEFPKSQIEFAAGRPVLHYRGQILPLVALGSLLDPNSKDKAMDQDPLQVIVFSEGTQRIGLVVEKIIDILDETITANRPSSSPGLLGSAVVGEKVIDFVDLQAAVLAFGDQTISGVSGGLDQEYRLLLMDSSPLSRGTLRGYLEMIGYRITEASGVQEALEKLSRHPVDLVVTTTKLGLGGGWELLEGIRKQASLAHLPVLGIANQTDELSASSTSAMHFEGQHLRSDREGLLKSIGKLVRSGKARAVAAGGR